MAASRPTPRFLLKTGVCIVFVYLFQIRSLLRHVLNLVNSSFTERQENRGPENQRSVVKGPAGKLIVRACPSSLLTKVREIDAKSPVKSCTFDSQVVVLSSLEVRYPNRHCKTQPSSYDVSRTEIPPVVFHIPDHARRVCWLKNPVYLM